MANVSHFPENCNRFSGVALLYFLLLFSIHLSAQEQKALTGKVIDYLSQQPILGATITANDASGKKSSAFTDAQGSFRIRLTTYPLELKVAFVGYKSQSIQISDSQSPVTISLAADQNALNEVVVIGYGSQRKKNLVGAVGTFETKDLEEKPLTRVDQAIIGQVAGVQVRQPSGMVGSGLSIQVRGNGSITAGSEPLYVIDGFPLDVASQTSAGGFSYNPLNDLNPNDIESIQILKDAAAGAIYGSRAANGVVIITTKQGKEGSVKISLNAKTGFSKVSRKVDMLSPKEWVQMATTVANANWVASGTGRTADQTNATRRTILGLGDSENNTSYMTDDRWSEDGHPGLTYVDWQDALFQTAPFQNYEISASGGSKTAKYFISGNYLDQKGTIVNSSYKNYNLRANLEANVNQRIRFGLNLAPSYSESNIPSAEGKDNQLMKALQISPVVESTAGLYSGTYGYDTYTWSSPKLVSPYAYVTSTKNLAKLSRILASGFVEVELIHGLKLKSSINYDASNQNKTTYIPDVVVYGAATEVVTNPGKNSSGTYSGFLKQNFVNENTASYFTTLAGNHNLSAVVGTSYNSVHNENFSISTAGGYANDLVYTLNNAIANSSGVTTTGTTTESNNTLFSYYGRFQYDYQGKYLASATVRRDASSKFGSDNRWGTFPSASFGWRISQESFFRPLKFVNDLKVRFSWGKSGNDNIGNYSAIPTFTSTTYSFGGNSATASTGQVVAGLANPKLKWETSNTYNLGLDASFIDSHIVFTVDAYRKKNTDLLLNVPVLTTSGFSSSLQNMGAVENNGLEFSLNTVNFRLKDFEWKTNANIAFNNNKVVALSEGVTSIQVSSSYSANAPYLLQVGLPIYSFNVIKVSGILTQADMDDSNVAKLSKETVGDPKFYDANGDGVINSSDRVVYGRPTPKYTWGLTNSFRYKDFDLNVQIYGQQGGSMISFLGRAIDFSGSTTANVLGVWRNHWTTDNQNYNAPRGKFGATYTAPTVTSDWVYSTDFWRIQDITLGYNLKFLAKKKLVRATRLYVSAQNWFSHDKYYGGANPEAQNTNISSDSSYPVPGDYGAMPVSKSLVFGANFSF